MEQDPIDAMMDWLLKPARDEAVARSFYGDAVYEALLNEQRQRAQWAQIRRSRAADLIDEVAHQLAR